MRLLNTQSLELSATFTPSEVPDYAILSHRWSDEEVTFADIIKEPIARLESQARTRLGFAKIQGACKLALRDGYTWIWIDSCCIDKSSSAELQETINSMWRYYAESNTCYVYMADVPGSEAGWGQTFAQSEWFTRGWTLQELLVPICVEFYTKRWESIGTKLERYEMIAEITSIDSDILLRKKLVEKLSIAERLSWAAHRKVTREEDGAYSLLGLFDINMPLLYGEGGGKAFLRLQEAVYNSTADHTLFLFRYSRHTGGQPLLADSLTRFCGRSYCPPCSSRVSQCLPLEFSYTNVVPSDTWLGEAHEQIMSTFAWNETSTVLPLLEYRDISDILQYFDNDKPRQSVTHVAILNRTLENFPRGALCLLLWRQPDMDATVRLHAIPAVLPHLGHLVPKFQKTKLLIMPGPIIPEPTSSVGTTFSLKSDIFRVEAWGTEIPTGQSILSAETEQDLCFMRERGKVKTSNRISCQITDCQDPMLVLAIQLVWRDEIWSIKEVVKLGPDNREGDRHTLFLSANLADRCSVFLPDGKRLSIGLRRLPGSARARQEDNVIRIRCQISVGFTIK